VRRCLRDPTFGVSVEHRLVTDGQTGNRQTERVTERHTTTACTVLAERRAVKKITLNNAKYATKKRKNVEKLDSD